MINEIRTVVDWQEDKFFFFTFSRLNDFTLSQIVLLLKKTKKRKEEIQ